MYAVSWDETGYLVLRQEKNRREAEESLRYEILNLIYKHCFDCPPQTAVLKNSELRRFPKDHPTLISNLELFSPDLKIDRVGSGLYPLIVFLPPVMKKYIAIRRKFEKDGKKHTTEEIVRLAKEQAYGN